MTTNKATLQQEFANRTAYAKSIRYKFNIGGTKGIVFFVEIKDGQILGYTQAAWNRRGQTGLSTSLKIKASEIGESAIATFTDNWIIQKANGVIDGVVAYANKVYYDNAIRDLYLYWKSPFKNQVATVRTDNGVSAQERTAVSKRLPRVHAALQKKLGPLQKVPKIAVVASGGGYRAMLFSLGFLAGAEKNRVA